MTIATTMTTLTMTMLMKTMVIEHEPIARIAWFPVTLPLHASCANIIAWAIPSVALLVGNAADNASEISGADSPASMQCKYFLSGRDENMYYMQLSCLLKDQLCLIHGTYTCLRQSVFGVKLKRVFTRLHSHLTLYLP